MLTYSQSKGEMLDNGILVGIGYAGLAAGKNNPAAQAMHNFGPIPQGKWRIVRWFDSEHFGPTVAELEPESGTQTFGRSGFLCHGANPAHPDASSTGCIVLGNAARVALRKSGETELQVVE